MAAFGRDFQSYTRPRLYHPSNPVGLWIGLALAAALVVANLVLQTASGMVVLSFLFDGDANDLKSVVKAFMIGIFPASLVTIILALYLSRIQGGNPSSILALRWPDLGWAGWITVVGGFLIIMTGVIAAIVAIFQIDMAQYTPGVDGSSPESGSAGLVKEAMFDLANEPFLFWLAFPAVALGAPLAEEFIFRGQLFATLSNSRAGLSGATLITALLWSLLHMSEPWLSVGLIFAMGLVLGALLIRFGSLWVTIICHGVWNAVYSLIIFTSPPQ